MGHKDGSTGPTANPDYFEHPGKLSAKDLLLQKNRRVYYWIMRGALLPEGDSGLVCNPTEYWHWSYGDQMWAALMRAPYAFYGAQEAPQAR
jgi:D-alanyl-D-alanine dipeptidase